MIGLRADIFDGGVGLQIVVAVALACMFLTTSTAFAQNALTAEEARQIIVEGINYAAYRETDSSLYDSDKNRLFGSEHYNSGRHVVKPSP